MTNTGMFFRMLFSAVFRRRSRAVMAVVASLVGAATLFCLARILPRRAAADERGDACVRREPDCHAHRIDQC